MKSNLTLETLDKINLIKVDITFISNLLIAWNVEQTTLSYTDMHGLSRLCDNVYTQLNECQEIIETLREDKA